VITQRISIKSSVLISIAVCVVHLAAGVLPWLLPIPVAGKAVLSFAIAFSLIYFMARDAGLHAANSIVALELRSNGEMAMQLLKGEWLDCALLESSFVSPQMTVINLLPRGRRFSRRLILVPDNVDPRDFRRLRIWLRWKGGEDVSAVQLVDTQ
jgi:toxin CptA